MTGLPLNIDIQQIFLHMLNFVILAGGLYFILYKPVIAFMDKRKGMYEEMEQNADAARAEAEALKQKYSDRLSDAREEAERIRADAAREAESIVAAARDEADREGARIVADARRQGEREKDRMVEDAKKNIIDLVIEAERRLLDRAEGNEE